MNRVVHILFLMFLAVGLNATLYAQTAGHQPRLEITITDAGNKPVRAAIISLLAADSAALIFAKTDEKGFASIAVDSLEWTEIKYLKVSAPGFELYYDAFANVGSQQIVRLAAEKTITLNNVTVRSRRRPRIKAVGDTLSYSVKDFQHKGDRVLSDILQRLPGLSVDAQGKVSYNGQPISNLYIEGDDVLDGRYERATKNIRSDLVDTIQVLERNQHIRVLQGIVVPDKTAINVSLKPDATAQWFQQAKAGAGIGAFDVGWNALMVKPAFKSILTAASNKTGETNIHPATISADDMEVPEAVSGRLSAAPVSTPALPARYWLNNNSTLFTANQFWKNKKQGQFRLVAGYGAEHERRNATEQFYFPGFADTVAFLQSGNSNIRLRTAEISTAYIINTDKRYTEISLKTNLVTNHTEGLWMLAAKQTILQLKNPVSTVHFKAIHLIQTGNNGYLRFAHQTRYQNSREQLTIHPGVFQEIINDNEPFLKAVQAYDQRPVVINNTAGWHQGSGMFRQAYTAGLNVYMQNIASGLATVANNGSVHTLQGPYQKTFSGNAFTPFISGEWSRVGDISELNLVGTATYQQTRFANEAKPPKQVAADFMPHFSLRYRLASGKENEFRIHTVYRTALGSLSDLFDGAVLSDYRTLAIFDRQLQQQQFQTYAARYTFKKSVHMLSAYVGMGWERQHLQNLDSLTIGETRSVQFSSSSGYKVSEWRVQTGASKHFFAVQTTVNIKAQVSESASQRMQNGLVIPFEVRKNELSAGFVWQPKSKYNVGYTIERKAGRTGRNASFENWRNHIKGAAQITPVFLIAPSLEYFNFHFNHQSTRLLFSEVVFRYTIPKTKADVEVEGQNLFDQHRIRWMALDQGFVHITDYRLRPRTLLVRVRFAF